MKGQVLIKSFLFSLVAASLTIGCSRSEPKISLPETQQSPQFDTSQAVEESPQSDVPQVVEESPQSDVPQVVEESPQSDVSQVAEEPLTPTSNSESVEAQLTTEESPPPVPSNTDATPDCATWETLKAAVRSGEITIRQPIPELPEGFKNGCISADIGAHTLNIYVRRDGVAFEPPSMSPELLQTYPFYKVVPIGGIEEEFVHVYFDSPGVTTRQFIQENAWEEPYIDREDNTVMFRYLYMESDVVPLEEMAQLLETTREEWE
jgi:hypothetical protein